MFSRPYLWSHTYVMMNEEISFKLEMNSGKKIYTCISSKDIIIMNKKTKYYWPSRIFDKCSGAPS